MKKLIVVLVAMISLFLAVPLWACSVPVFRYALERWQADPYEVLVFHRGELSPEQQKLADLLSSDGQAGKLHANIRLTQVDLDADPDPQLLQIWESQETQTLPWMTVRYPLQTRIPVDSFRGALTKENATALLDSPLRREIARRLLTGDTSVFVLLESGDQEKDEAAFKLVEEQAAQLGQSLKLPDIAAEDLDEVSIDPTALRLAFSTIRLSRDDPAEKLFVEMLLGSEEDLHDLHEPMVFPVFGRGRVLYALIGQGITMENIQQAGVDLTGPCTCTVKDQNPGVDLVMAVDWDSLVDPKVEIDKELPPLAGLGSFSPDLQTTANEKEAAAVLESPHSEPTSTAIAEKPAAPQPLSTVEESTENPLLRNLLIICGLAIVILFAGSMFMFRKQA